MKNIVAAFCVTIAAGIFAFGQTTVIDDYKKVEGYVGYSNGQVDTGVDSGSDFGDFFRDRLNYNGFEVSGVYNFNRYWGVKGDMSGTFNDNEFTTTAISGPTTFQAVGKAKNQLWNFVGGVQAKDNSNEGSFKPFGHAMIGAGYAHTEIRSLTCAPALSCPFVTTNENNFSETGFAAVFGGGIDFRVGNRFQIRAIQVDYNPVWVFGQVNNNWRFGAGIVF